MPKSKNFEFPEINEELWKDFKEGSVPKNKVNAMITDGLRFLIDIQLLRKSSYLTAEMLSKSTQKAREVDQNLEELKEKFRLTDLVQNLLGRKIEEMTKKEDDVKADTRTLFNRLEVLALEACVHGSLREHSKESIDEIYRKNRRMIDSYLVKIKVFNRDTRTNETRYFLPTDWRNDAQKYTAFYLRQLQIRTTLRWMKEKGIEPKTKPETKTAEPKITVTPAKPETPTIPDTKPKTPKTPKPKPKKTASKPRTTKKSPKKDEADVKAAKRAKAIKAEAREDTDNEDIRGARGKSTKDFADLDFLKK